MIQIYGGFEAEMSDFLGKTFTEIRGGIGDDELIFVCAEGIFKMLHEQDCCESVSIEDITGDLQDLIGSPILVAEESTSNENPETANPETVEYQESFTWTFYKFATKKGYVDIRWYGGSNGYYSESVGLYFEPTKVKEAK
jgi:hypothetical protein